jgi:hypothetical protein
VRADHTAAEHDHLPRIDAGNATQEDPLPAVRLLEIMRTRLHRHSACDFRHRRKERQASRRGSHRFVRNRHGAAFDQIGGLLGIRREMQIGEQNLPRLQHSALVRLGLLHLDDHFRRLEHVARGGGNLRSGTLIVIVGHADALPRIVLDDNLVAVCDDFAHGLRRKTDPILENLDFLRNADAHQRPLRMGAGKVTPAWRPPVEPAATLGWCQVETAAGVMAHAAASVAMPGSIRVESMEAKPSRA